MTSFFLKKCLRLLGNITKNKNKIGGCTRSHAAVPAAFQRRLLKNGDTDHRCGNRGPFDRLNPYANGNVVSPQLDKHSPYFPSRVAKRRVDDPSHVLMTDSFNKLSFSVTLISLHGKFHTIYENVRETTNTCFRKCISMITWNQKS